MKKTVSFMSLILACFACTLSSCEKKKEGEHFGPSPIDGEHDKNNTNEKFGPSPTDGADEHFGPCPSDG